MFFAWLFCLVGAILCWPLAVALDEPSYPEWSFWVFYILAWVLTAGLVLLTLSAVWIAFAPVEVTWK